MNHSHRSAVSVPHRLRIDKREICLHIIERIGKAELNVERPVICPEPIEADTQEDVILRVIPVGLIVLDAIRQTVRKRMPDYALIENPTLARQSIGRANKDCERPTVVECGNPLYEETVILQPRAKDSASVRSNPGSHQPNVGLSRLLHNKVLELELDDRGRLVLRGGQIYAETSCENRKR